MTRRADRSPALADAAAVAAAKAGRRAGTDGRSRSLRSSLSIRVFLLRLGQQLVHGFIQLLIVQALEADRSLAVQHVDGRPAADVPGFRDRAVGPLGAIPERAPG